MGQHTCSANMCRFGDWCHVVADRWWLPIDVVGLLKRLSCNQLHPWKCAIAVLLLWPFHSVVMGGSAMWSVSLEFGDRAGSVPESTSDKGKIH